MSTKIERAGQEIGPYVVLPDEAKRTKRSEVLWPLQDTRDGEVRYRKGWAVSRLAKQHGVPKPRLSVTTVRQ